MPILELCVALAVCSCKKKADAQLSNDRIMHWLPEIDPGAGLDIALGMAIKASVVEEGGGCTFAA